MRYKVPDSTKYFCQSEAVAYYLQKYVVYRKRKIYVGKRQLNDLENVFNKFNSETYLIPTSDVLKPEIPAFLESLQINWKRAVLYKTVVNNLSHLRDVYYDVLVFFSPSGIESLFKNFPDFFVLFSCNTNISKANFKKFFFRNKFLHIYKYCRL